MVTSQSKSTLPSRLSSSSTPNSPHNELPEASNTTAFQNRFLSVSPRFSPYTPPAHPLTSPPCRSRESQQRPLREQQTDDTRSLAQPDDSPSVLDSPVRISPRLPVLELPHSNLDLTMSFNDILEADLGPRSTPVSVPSHPHTCPLADLLVLIFMQ